MPLCVCECAKRVKLQRKDQERKEQYIPRAERTNKQSNEIFYPPKKAKFRAGDGNFKENKKRFRKSAIDENHDAMFKCECSS